MHEPLLPPKSISSALSKPTTRMVSVSHKALFFKVFVGLLLLLLGPLNASTKEEQENFVDKLSKKSSGLPMRSLVAVQGVVYCKSCKYQGVDTLLGASPLSDAMVRMECNNSKYTQRQEARTDKNGYFFIQGTKRVTTYGAHKCKVFLLSSPSDSCSNATDLHYGVSGATLKYYQSPSSPAAHRNRALPFALFTVGPFAFDPTSCPH